jgi:chromosome segregation ATPase
MVDGSKAMGDDDHHHEETLRQLEQRISSLTGELERMQPNMKALEKFDEISDRLAREESELDDIKVSVGDYIYIDRMGDKTFLVCCFSHQ